MKKKFITLMMLSLFMFHTFSFVGFATTPNSNSTFTTVYHYKEVVPNSESVERVENGRVAQQSITEVGTSFSSRAEAKMEAEAKIGVSLPFDVVTLGTSLSYSETMTTTNEIMYSAHITVTYEQYIYTYADVYYRDYKHYRVTETRWRNGGHIKSVDRVYIGTTKEEYMRR